MARGAGAEHETRDPASPGIFYETYYESPDMEKESLNKSALRALEFQCLKRRLTHDTGTRKRRTRTTFSPDDMQVVFTPALSEGLSL